LISGFWSVINERLDPRTAKRQIGRIGAGATFGGLLGGLLAERIAALSSAERMLLLLGLLHFLCAALLLVVASGTSARRRRSPGKKPSASEATGRRGEGILQGLKTLGEVAYLRQLASLVFVTTVGATLIDYVFKTHAAASYAEGETLLRFFAVFYTAVSACTFLVQALFARRSLERLGLANTAATLPCGIAIGSILAVIAPGLASAAAARGGETVLRSSLFRSGYELFYTPLSATEKRSTKTIVDVGADRLGDAVGAGIVRAILLIGTSFALTILLVGALALSLLAVAIARVLQRGYVTALGRSLREQAVDLDLSMIEDSTTRGTIMQTVHALDLPDLRRKVATSDLRGAGMSVDRSTGQNSAAAEPRSVGAVAGGAISDPVLKKVGDLRSANASVIREVLAEVEKPDPVLVGHIAPLLAWDEICEEAIHALRGSADQTTGQLVDLLLDPNQEDAIRRRIPRVLGEASSQRAFDGLVAGLNDKRFEVRYQCGRALSRVRKGNPAVRIDPRAVFGAVLREVKVGRPVWRSRRLLDERLDSEEPSFVDEVVRMRSDRSLEHVFTLLALTLPQEALRIAYRGLHTDDPNLRGTALEYLESVLPAEIREGLWPFLDDQRPKERRARASADSLDELLRSQESIQINLAALRERSGGRDPKDR
jgi:hypothetical protein